MSRRNLDARVHIYESEYSAIVAEARRLPQTETGGDLYGTFTHGSNPVIWLASGPGPKVRHERAHFEQDSAFTTYWESRLTREFGLQYIGSWHSHHFLGLEQPSSGDVGSAQIYAQQHHRQTTLEIIVNHHPTGKRGEQEFSTTIKPYFYPDAQRAKVEGCVLASLIPLAGISPVRQQLGGAALASFNLISWQKAAGFQLPSAPVAQSTLVDDDNEVIIPDPLGWELQSIADEVQDLNIQQNSSSFLLGITLTAGYVLALVVQKPPKLRVTQVNLIDASRNINENISTKLHEEKGVHFTINQNSRVLQTLVRVVPYIHREIVEEQRRRAEEQRMAAIEAELRRAKKRPGEPASFNQQGTVAQPHAEELLAAQQQLQDQRNIALQLDEQRQKAQSELDKQLIEAQMQLSKQESEIKQLRAQLTNAQQRLSDQQMNEQSILALRDRETEQQRNEAQQRLDTLQREVQEFEQRLQEAQNELAKRQQIEAQLGETRQQLEVQQRQAQGLEDHLREAQVKLATQQQLEAQLDTAQQHLEAQQREVSRLEAELDETKKQLGLLKHETERRHLHLPSIIKNRSGPARQEEQEKNSFLIGENFLIIAIATIVVIILVALIIVFMFGRMRVLAMY